MFSVSFQRKGTYGLLQAENIRSARCSRAVLSKLFAAREANFLSLLVLAKKVAVLACSRRLAKTIRHPFFLLYRQKDIDRIIERNGRNYVIDKLTCEIMEKKDNSGPGCSFYEYYIFQLNSRVYIIIINKNTTCRRIVSVCPLPKDWKEEIVC